MQRVRSECSPIMCTRNAEVLREEESMTNDFSSFPTINMRNVTIKRIMIENWENRDKVGK